MASFAQHDSMAHLATFAKHNKMEEMDENVEGIAGADTPLLGKSFQDDLMAAGVVEVEVEIRFRSHTHSARFF